MIKLIATDMDGTLLNEKGKLPNNFFKTLEALKNRNIKFVIASGRPYTTLYENFKPFSDELYFICDNGAYIVEATKKPKVSIIDKNLIFNIIKSVESIKNIEILLCGLKGAYHRPINKNLTAEINKYYINQIEVNNLYDIDDEIFKITICDLKGPANNSYDILNGAFGNKLNIVISGQMWLDITNLGVNKGAALEEIQQCDGISYKETMVFGDFYNDLEMFDKAYYSFAMENANDDIKSKANFRADSNINNGVIKAIEQYALS